MTPDEQKRPGPEPSTAVDKEFAYRSVDQLTAQEFRQLIDGPTVPRNPVIASSERIDQRIADTFIPDEYLVDVLVFHEEDGTVTVVFPTEEAFEEALREKAEASRGNDATLGDVARSFGQIGLTLGRIVRARIRGLP